MPFGGLVTYSVVPTNGSSTPATVQINLDGPPPGTAVIYEPFDYVPGSLHGRGGTTEVGLAGTWDATPELGTVAATLNWNELAVHGNSQKLDPGNFGYADRRIAPGALAGLLDDGDTLWFSYIARMGQNGQQRNYFSIGSDGFQRAAYNAWGGLGRVAQGVVSPENGMGTGSETNGNIFAVANIPGNIGADGWDDNIQATLKPTIFTSQDQVALIVGKITFGTGGANDVLEVYVPTNMTTLGPVKSTISANLDQSQWDTISLFQKSYSGIDEIRVGATLQSVMPVPQTPYETWAGGTFAKGTLSEQTATGDSEADGLTNLMEYAFGTDPTVNFTGSMGYVAGGDVTTAGQPVPVESGGIYYAVFGRRKDHVAAGLTYTVQFSARLEAGYWWDSSAPPALVTGVASSGDIEAVSVPFPGPIPTASGTEAARFFRVKVSLAP